MIEKQQQLKNLMTRIKNFDLTVKTVHACQLRNFVLKFGGLGMTFP